MNELDTKESLLEHKKIIENNKFLNLIHKSFYEKIASNITQKPVIEIGSGPGFIKKIIPSAITTDVIEGPGIDKIAFAEKLPFKDKSVGSIVMLNVLHHIKNPTKAFKEFERCLKPNGKIVMVEPWPTLWSKFIYQNFHHEDFNINENWKIHGKGRMSDANGAIPWIIFKRDYKKFKKLFPNFKIEEIELHTPFKYLVSGNLSKPQLLPLFCYPVVNFVEKLLSPLNNYLAMFATIIIKKVDIRTTHD
ncbi:MAG: methyltransferase domain-containing protein [Patescibacteria group bacterium]